MQSNLCVHTKYENMDKIYLYPIWEFFYFFLSRNSLSIPSAMYLWKKMLDYICLKRLKYVLLLSFPKSIQRYCNNDKIFQLPLFGQIEVTLHEETKNLYELLEKGGEIK